MGVQSPAGELWKEASSVKRKKVNATASVLYYLKLIYRHTANFYEDPFQDYDF